MRCTRARATKYDASPSTMAAATLLEVDLEQDGIREAVEILTEPGCGYAACMPIAPVCPHCGHATSWTKQPQPVTVGAMTLPGQPYFGLAANQCPTCEKPTVWLEVGKYKTFGNGWVPDTQNAVGRWVYPTNASRALDARIPVGVRRDFAEAESVLPVSPNASAALSRRILQRLLREHAKVTGRNLEKEIDAFLETSPPSHVSDALHDVRGIGNTAAHGAYDAAGEIFDVSPVEASYTLETVYGLMDYLIVAPAKAAEAREAFNERRRANGVRELPERSAGNGGTS